MEEFLAKLPELWRVGEARPTHRSEPTSPRTWRTRKDSFEEVWEILPWLQHEPDSTAKFLIERLQREDPGRFPKGELRTIQRRIGDYNRVMIRPLVHTVKDGKCRLLGVDPLVPLFDETTRREI